MVAPDAGALTVDMRELTRAEIADVWTIDRQEVIDALYVLENGQLVLRPQHWEIDGWPPGEREAYTPILLVCFDHGGAVTGAFEGGVLAGVVVLEGRFIGRRKDQVQLKFLHVSQSHRRQGLGRALFGHAVGQARLLGAKKLYISATPSENTIDFYRHLGCRIAEEVDPDLFALEPEDIHLEYVVPEREERQARAAAAGRQPDQQSAGAAPCAEEGGECTRV
jgi:predicted N-acetyltransferase YhbS